MNITKDQKPYSPEKIEEIRSWVSHCETWLEARDVIVQNLGIHPDNATRMNRKYCFWSNEPIVDDVKFSGRKIRRLFVDIETSPNIVLSWRVGRKISIDYNSILKERAIICACWKWEGNSHVYSFHWDSDQNDEPILYNLVEALNDADEIIHHNGDKFDLPWIRTRCLFHGIRTLPYYKTVDTLKWARSKFAFNSNKLDYLAKFLGLGQKIKTEFGLWKEIVLDKCPKSMNSMVTYCETDVALLEQVWKRLSEVMEHQTHAGVLEGGEKWSCPFDGSTNIRLHRIRSNKNGIIKYQMQCNDCGSYYMIGKTAYEKYLESKM